MKKDKRWIKAAENIVDREGNFFHNGCFYSIHKAGLISFQRNMFQFYFRATPEERKKYSESSETHYFGCKSKNKNILPRQLALLFAYEMGL